jgi:tetratricopeptide (TPR) repeat protein
MFNLQIIRILLAALILALNFIFDTPNIKPRRKKFFIMFILLVIVLIPWIVIEIRVKSMEQEDYKQRTQQITEQIKESEERFHQEFTRLLNPIIEQKIYIHKEETRVDFDELLSLDTPEKRAYFHKKLGIAYYKKSNFQDAETEFKLAIENNPTDIGSNRFLGIIYSKQKRLLEGKSIYRTIVNLKPDISTLEEQLQLAVLYEYLGPDDTALRAALNLYNNIIKFNDAYVELAKSRIKHVNEQLKFEEKRREGLWRGPGIGLIPPIVVISFPFSGAELIIDEEIIITGTIATPRYGSGMDYYIVEYKNLDRPEAAWVTLIKVDCYSYENEILASSICKWKPIIHGKYVIRILAADLNGNVSSHQIHLKIIRPV